MKPEIYNRGQIEEALKKCDPIQSVEDGFVAYSQGRVIVPPVGELIFEKPPGDVHIKYGYIAGDDYYVIKIASGFPNNVELNIPSGDGMMLVFEQKTGRLACMLMDEGHLTNVRTAAAGAVSAKYLAPKNTHGIGVFGAGIQGRLQVLFLKDIIDCRDVYVWGINDTELEAYKIDLEGQGYHVHVTRDAGEVASNCNLIVMATPSKSPLLQSDQIRTGTHITAMGSDTLDKIELDPVIVQKADLVVVDSISQCLLRGEAFQAMKAGLFNKEDMVELGNTIQREELRRSSDEQITIADLTGVAVQDIQISVAVFNALRSQNEATFP